MWNEIRSYGRILKAFNGFFYDFKRFLYYGGWRANMYDIEQRNYHLVKVYHSLEKSMSFKNRNKDSGWFAANTVLDVLKIAKRTGVMGFHDRAALNVLKKYIKLQENIGTERARFIENEIQFFDFESLAAHGVKEYGIEEFKKGILKEPECFFFSRYSLREFIKETVDEATIKRAVTLAMKSPSVCNRQAWHVYHTTDSILKEKILRYQEGNRGFGEKIPNLMIITTDLKAFMSGQEHFQHWIDGGLFSMSIIYALHSLGVASCALNWSQTPANDKLLRLLVNVKPNHTVIMMLAVGWPGVHNKVCISARRPLEEIYSQLQSAETN